MIRVKTIQSTPTRSQLHGWLRDLGTLSGVFRVVEEGGSQRSPASDRGTVAQVEAFTIELTEGGRRIPLLVQPRGRAHPGQVLSVLVPLAARARASGGDAVAVLATHYVSDRVAEVCRAHGVGYLDGAGNAHLAAPGLWIDVQGRPNRSPDTRTAERIFAPRSSRIVRVMLEEPARAWQVQELAKTAKVSIGLASRVKRKLVDQAFATDDSEGVRLTDAEKLLHAWSSQHQPTRRRIPVYSLASPAEFERDVLHWGEQHGVQCALGEFSAAARLAPMVRGGRAVVHVFVPRGSDVVDRLMQDLELKPVESGATGELWVTDDEAVFRSSRDVDGVRVTSPLQTYLDLRANPSRGEEAAEEIYRRWLLPRHQAAEVNT